ncbi:methyltransferase domain-containing protein [Mesorhizobium sp. B2-3-11]|uniref:class I SAM-dependent methyltransferase n=1 Tax=Mesorhizobium sp. B2-3-11 TaxID=2589953 RepID=UPI00112E2680|nr:methyltransferase domain-containing protein [Mesorhizobium sp. B2-3-11]TPM05383.1 methyltransferase domain-containing protein [Mesorhizobium sp. B2-3-11]
MSFPVGSISRSSSRCSKAMRLRLPFPDGSFTAAYMLHVGMNIADKGALFSEVARVLRAGARFGVFDVMRAGAGELAYPLPWASTADTNAIAAPEQYRDTLSAAGFEILSERQRRDVALDHFARQRAQATTGRAVLGVQTLMGARGPEIVKNMSESISGRPDRAGRDCCPKGVMAELDRWLWLLRVRTPTNEPCPGTVHLW